MVSIFKDNTIFFFNRDLYFSTIYHQLLDEDLLKDVHQSDLPKVIALIAQIKFGDFNAESVPEYQSLLPNLSWSIELQKSVETEHLNLDMMTLSEVKIEFIKTFSEFPNYGMETFNVDSTGDHLEHFILGVRHDGLRIIKNSPETGKIVQL